MSSLTGLFRASGSAWLRSTTASRAALANISTPARWSSTNVSYGGISRTQGGHSDSATARNVGLFATLAVGVGLIAYHSFNQVRTNDVFGHNKSEVDEVTAELKREEYAEEERRLAVLRKQAAAEKAAAARK